MPFGYVDWKKNCSMLRSSYCAKRSHSLLRRSFGKNLCADADWTNTAPTNHSCSCGRLHRWFRSWSDRRRRNTTGNRCWYRWLPAGSAIPMYGCRSPDKYRNRRHRIRDSWWCMSPDIGHNDSYCIHYSWHDHARNGQFQRMCPGTNTFRTTGSCR